MESSRKNRTREELYIEILTDAKDGIRVTDALFKYRLNWDMFQKHFGFLISKELLEYDGGSRLYQTTEKGERFVGTLGRMKKFKNGMPPETALRAANLL